MMGLRFRVIARFFVLGAMLLVVRRVVHLVVEPGPQSLVVTVPKEAAEAEVQRAVDEAVLLNAAVAQRLHLTDGVVRHRLVANMRFANPDSEQSDDELFQRAVSLGMHLSDRNTRARMLESMRRMLLSQRPFGEPTSEQLTAYMRAHRERFELPEEWALSQVFISRQIHGEAAYGVARRLLKTLRAEGVRPDAAGPMADPTLLPHQLRGSPRVLDGRFGAGFAQSLTGLPLRSWEGPVKSSFGMHLIWIREWEKPRLPPLAEAREKVLKHFQHDARERHLKVLVGGLRERYDIEIRRGS